MTSSIIDAIRTELLNSLTDQKDAIQRCGPAVLALLKRSLEFLDEASADPVEPSHGSAPAFRSLLALADEKINAVPFSSVTLEWLRLYTDATIGTALYALVRSVGRHDDDWREESDKWRDIVRRLDMAIIVSGAPGSNRPRMIQDLIKEAQRRIHKPSSVGNGTTFTSERPTKRRRLSAGRETLTASETRFSPNAIPVLDTPPSIAAFLSMHRTTPFIIRGYISDVLQWPACSRWNSTKALLHRVGLGRVVPVEVGRSYTDQGWGQQILPFERFLRLVGFPDAPSADEAEVEEDREYDGLPLYLAQHALFAQFPELKKDFTLPDYVYSEPPAPEDMPEYAPPGNADGVVVNVWIGSGKHEVISPAHTDPYYNCYAQVLSCKRVWVAPPSATPHMYAFDDEAGDGDAATTTSYTTNTSKVSIFEDPTENHRQKFPAFYEKALPSSMEALLEPGDMLFMPPKWWHAMKSEGEGVSWSVSMWF